MMNSYYFKGRILPERANINLSISYPLLVNPLEPGDSYFSGEAFISVENSQLSVKYNIEKVVDNINTLKNYVERTVRIFMDTYGYLKGCAYDVDIISVTTPDGAIVNFNVTSSPTIQNSEDQRPFNFEDTLKLTYKSRELHQAFADLREAIIVPWDTGFFCNRAVENIRQSFVQESGKSGIRKSWERLRGALNIDEDWLKKLTKFSEPQRHGSCLFMSASNRDLAMQRAWKVVDRFCLYIANGRKKLSELGFEQLKDPSGPSET